METRRQDCATLFRMNGGSQADAGPPARRAVGARTDGQPGLEAADEGDLVAASVAEGTGADVRRPVEAGAARDRGVKARTRTGDAARLAAVGAVVTAVITAVLSPSTFSAVQGWFVEDDAKNEGTTPRVPLEFEGTSSRDGSITISIPQDWGSGGGRWDLPFAGRIDVGSAVKGGIGAGLTSSNSFDEPNMYLGASSKAAERLGLPGREEEELADYLTVLVRFLDYTKEGCTLSREGSIEKPGFIGRYRVWDDCRNFEGTRFWDAYYVSEAGDVLLSATLVSVATTTEDEETRMLTDWSIRPEKLPTSKETQEAGENGYPAPEWSVGPHGETVTP